MAGGGVAAGVAGGVSLGVGVAVGSGDSDGAGGSGEESGTTKELTAPRTLCIKPPALVVWSGEGDGAGV